MSYRKESVRIQYADRILGALNRVEMLRLSASNGHDFSLYGEQAARLWHTAQEMEKAIIRANSLPDIDAMLAKIMTEAETCSGCIGNEILVHSYMRSAKSLAWIIAYLEANITPFMRKLLELILADGFTVLYGAECFPTQKMVEWQCPEETDASEAEAKAVQAAMDRAVAEEEAKGGEA